ncbi:hypothetical protein [Enterococcus sp. AZ196]|uniref:hypothetical protein n=1 Tax=Enterococcus sp. AZ196 TaxID=2774659 RepID=UPI003D2CB390
MNDLYQEIGYKEMFSMLQATRTDKIKLTKEEYEIIIAAKKSGDYSKVKQTEIYNKQSGDYCALLQLLPYHEVRLLFFDLPNGDTAVLNKDRIFNNDYLKIATIKGNRANFHTLIVYPEERRVIDDYINK